VVAVAEELPQVVVLLPVQAAEELLLEVAVVVAALVQVVAGVEAVAEEMPFLHCAVR
jgi:hypothetical protein